MFLDQTAQYDSHIRLLYNKYELQNYHFNDFLRMGRRFASQANEQNSQESFVYQYLDTKFRSFSCFLIHNKIFYSLKNKAQEVDGSLDFILDFLTDFEVEFEKKRDLSSLLSSTINSLIKNNKNNCNEKVDYFLSIRDGLMDKKSENQNLFN